jgi:ketosteroid isomerase-like protein
VTGRSAIHDAVDNFLSTIESSAHRIERIVEQDACAVCEGWVRYVRRDGRVLELPFCNVLTFRDPLILRYHVYIDPSPLAAP